MAPVTVVAFLLVFNAFLAFWFGTDSASFTATVVTGFLLVAVVGLRIEKRLIELSRPGDHR